MIRDERMAKLANKFLVGCDPEAVALGPRGGLVNLRDKISQSGSVGYDHNGDVFEVRPKPFRGTYSLVKQMKELLNTQVPTTITRLRAGAVVPTSSRTLYLGGHIHLDLPWTGSGKVITALDRLTEVLESLDILPTQESLTRRQSHSGYGRFSDVRVAGEGDRMEYRTMASWLFSPSTAFLCLTLGKLAAVDPTLATETLKIGEQKSLRAFLEAFAEKDINAKRVLERLFEKRVRLQADPEKNVLAAWEGKLTF